MSTSGINGGAGGVSRRDFMKMAVAGGIAAAGGGAVLSQTTSPPKSSTPGVPMRTLGRTGEKVSCIGLGGFHMAKPKDPEESVRLVRTAIDNGINFMDNCWDYHDGESELRMGKALRDGYREKAFLMSKIDGRTKKYAAKQIDESLARLRTDRIDLMQFHEVIRMEDPDRFFADDGAMAAFVEAKQAGKIRYIGFTGHKDPAIHLRMLEMAAARQFRFDTVQMPLNVMDAHFRSFEKQVLPVLLKEEMGVLGMKPLGSGVILQSKVVTPIECLHYALTLPTSVVITGMENLDNLTQALQAARTFKPLGRDAVSALLNRTASFAQSGKYELFKTDTRFDGTAHHPEWMAPPPSPV